MLPFQVAVALLAFAAAALLALRGTAAILVYHLVFAVGIVPLILAAMLHFVPVLARAKNPPRAIRALPVVALGGGLIVAGFFAFPLWLPAGLRLGSALIAAAVAMLAAWSLRLRIRAIGTPHPGLDWYLAALACLFLALAAVLAGQFIPGQRAALRLLHLHLNTLGFIGITALGTLQVLLPTSANRPDPAAAPRMRRQLKWAAAGALLIACGAAWHPWLAWGGLLALTAIVLIIARTWLQLYAREIFVWHGATPSLATALLGYTATLALGAAHGSHAGSLNPVAMFIVAFLMPLVTGAASQLLPLWLRPGRQTAWHLAARQHLGYGSAARALLFLSAGAMLGFGHHWAWILALLGAGSFLVRTIALARKKGLIID